MLHAWCFVTSCNASTVSSRRLQKQIGYSINKLSYIKIDCLHHQVIVCHLSFAEIKMSCIFCESHFADPILPHNRQKICELFDVSFTGKKLLHDGKVCTRCHVQVQLIDNAVKLKSEMSQCLQDKLGKHEDRLAGSVNGNSYFL